MDNIALSNIEQEVVAVIIGASLSGLMTVIAFAREGERTGADLSSGWWNFWSIGNSEICKKASLSRSYHFRWRDGTCLTNKKEPDCYKRSINQFAIVHQKSVLKSQNNFEVTAF
ncbi:hypothetical protein [Sporosarcina obsidiansis]|uniref:hypothetical protein n=1 Tax=Sporosarcina obsidiansis TaxID=2660748 RepID=UPI00129B265E|nr:hypothetical protein [Sporosarcina obsidiansis]